MSGDVARLMENKAFDLDPQLVQHLEIGMHLVFATTSKLKTMTLRIFDNFMFH